ncbi:MAG: hypothetical protein JRM82_02055 [Nitrososphaerota archaeon]|nr:hypothetical protein [Nitrososphaerota archaeon]
MSTTDYPFAVYDQSCVLDSNHTYCIGGYDRLSFLKSVHLSTVGTSQANPTTRSTSSNATSGSVSGTQGPTATGYAPLALAVAVVVISAVMLVAWARLAKRVVDGTRPTGQLSELEPADRLGPDADCHAGQV